jgi:hypothetical protein
MRRGKAKMPPKISQINTSMIKITASAFTTSLISGSIVNPRPPFRTVSSLAKRGSRLGRLRQDY